MKEICTLLVKLHIIFSRMQRVNQHARPSIIQVGCPTCCYQVRPLDHANGGAADLDMAQSTDIVMNSYCWRPSYLFNGDSYTDKIIFILNLVPGGWFNIMMPSCQYRKSHCGDKTILWPFYLHNGISYTSNITSLYWIWFLVSPMFSVHLQVQLVLKLINGSGLKLDPLLDLPGLLVGGRPAEKKKNIMIKLSEWSFLLCIGLI